MGKPKEIFCIDPGLETVDHEACQEMADLGSSFIFSHHLVAVEGMESVYEREKDIELGGMIVLGSIASVNDSYPWQKKLNDWLLKKMKEGIPTFGICYGHQLIAHLFGGTVGFLREDQSKFAGFRSFEVLSNCPFDLKEKKLEVIASHCEEVKKLPSELEVCARSKSVPVEGLRHKTLPIVGFQCHPEARYNFSQERGVSLEGKKDPFKGGKSLVRAFISYLESFHS